MIEELTAGVDGSGLLFCFCLFLPEDPWFLACDEVCLVAVLVAVCSVFVEEVVHLKWVGNGNKSWHRTADFFSAVLHAQLSNFPLLSEKF